MKQADQRTGLIILLFSSIVAMLPNSVLFPAETVLSNHLQTSISFVGWMVTTYAVAYVLSTPILGIVSDFMGRRVVLISGLLLFAVGGLVPMFTTHQAPILIGRFVMGIGSAGIQPMVDSLIGDIFPPGKSRRQAFAFFGAAIAVAEAFAPFLGGAVAQFWWRGVFLLYASAVLAAFLCLRLKIVSHRAQAAEPLTVATYRKSLFIATRIPQLAMSVFGAFIFGIVYFGVCALLPIAHAGSHGALANGFLFLPIGLVWLLGSVSFARWTQVRHMHRLALFAVLLLCFATGVLAIAKTWLLIGLVSGLWGIGASILATLFTWVINDESPNQVRGAMNGVYNAAYVLGFSIGAPLFLGIAHNTSFTCACLIGVGLLFVLCPFLYVAYRRIPNAGHINSESTANL